jgi:hypothetical protein
MAQYLCTERPTQILGQETPAERLGHPLISPTRGESSRGELGSREPNRHSGHEPMRPAAEVRRDNHPAGRALGADRPDPIRSGRDALLASLDRPLGAPARPGEAGAPAALAGDAARLGNRSNPVVTGETGRGRGNPAITGDTGRLGNRPGGAFDDDPDAPKSVPDVPSLAVLRPRRGAAAAAGPETAGDKPRKRLPSWDDVLFGSSPAARESS